MERTYFPSHWWDNFADRLGCAAGEYDHSTEVTPNEDDTKYAHEATIVMKDDDDHISTFECSIWSVPGEGEREELLLKIAYRSNAKRNPVYVTPFGTAVFALMYA